MEHNHIQVGAKPKTIRKVIRAKIEEWLKSIEDENVRNMAQANVIVTGGSIASMLLGEKINDFDIYFRDLETTKQVAVYYVNQFIKRNAEKCVARQPYIKVTNLLNCKGEEETRVGVWIQSAGAAGEGTNDTAYQYYEMTDNAHGDSASAYVNELLTSVRGSKEEEKDETTEEKKKYRPVFMSQNAISLSDKVQIVIRFYGDPEQIHRNYDFVHATCSYDYGKDHLALPQKALEALLSRTLIYQGSLYPICSIFRTKKFIERGWRISAGEMVKMCFQIAELNLNDPYTLREQLTGVDAAYFHELIRLIDEWKANPENNGKPIDSSYIVQLVDKVFENTVN